MVRAKRSGKGTIVEYSAAMPLVEHHDDHLRAALTAAMEETTLDIALQPVIDTTSGHVRGMEALLRLPYRDAYADPLLVVTAASRGGLLPDLTAAVLDRATRAGARSASDDPADSVTHRIHVNVLPAELNTDHLVRSVTEVIDAGLLAPDHLVLEISERSIGSDTTDVQRGIARMHAIGVQIALDDFGSGPSCLTDLGALDVDIIKLAPALTATLDRLPRMAAVVRTLVDMADRLGCTVIAEGVERPAQLAALRRLGVPLAQGYLLGAPQLGTHHHTATSAVSTV